MTTAITIDGPGFSLGNLSYIGPDYDQQLPYAAVAAPKHVRSLLAGLREWLRRRQVMAELAMMTDRELADIGLARCDIVRVFDPVFAAERVRDRDYIAF